MLGIESCKNEGHYKNALLINHAIYTEIFTHSIVQQALITPALKYCTIPSLFPKFIFSPEQTVRDICRYTQQE